MKVLELYCGIGGFHCALKGSTLREQFEITMAVDVNPICTQIYAHNFPGTNIVTNSVHILTAAEVNSLSPDLLLLSPPCQPFTRQGNQKDIDDARNDSFLHLMELIPELTSVSYILIENVKGFETSQTRHRLLSVLTKSNFFHEEYLLNPYQFGICNSRLRYYLLAKKTPFANGSTTLNCSLPANYEDFFGVSSEIPKNVSDILEFHPSCDDWHSFLVPQKDAIKYFPVMDIIGLDSDTSCCFTRGYTRYLHGTGSVLSALCREELKKLDLNSTKSDTKYSNAGNLQISELVKKLKLRFFTPQEVARLMLFPESFSFPENVTLKQRYKVLSNSINVYVVSMLISYLTKKD